MVVERTGIEARIKSAISKGWSASKWIAEEKSVGMSYRRTDMLADWRDIGEYKKKEGLARYVRKGYVPSERAAEVHVWAMSKEYMYKVRCETVLRPDLPVVTRFVNIMSDSPMTVGAIEREVWERSFTQSPPAAGEERKFVIETAIHRAEE